MSVFFAALLLLAPAAIAKGQPEEVGRERAEQVASSTSDDQGRDQDDDRGRSDDDNMASSTDRGQGEANRSTVATRVQELLRVADRDGGIGEQVREVAREYASSTERVEKAKTEVEGRPSWMQVLIGADYRNLGALRSEVVTTENQINRLSEARDRAVSAEVKASLETEIAALRDTASSTKAFIEEKESGFSLLGWLFRMF